MNALEYGLFDDSTEWLEPLESCYAELPVHKRVIGPLSAWSTRTSALRTSTLAESLMAGHSPAFHEGL
jgi:hypothetical protein